jgi:hypothetical protein
LVWRGHSKRVRSQTLYPAELRARACKSIIAKKIKGIQFAAAPMPMRILSKSMRVLSTEVFSEPGEWSRGRWNREGAVAAQVPTKRGENVGLLSGGYTAGSDRFFHRLIAQLFALIYYLVKLVRKLSWGRHRVRHTISLLGQWMIRVSCFVRGHSATSI